MKPYYEQDGITIYHGDCREVLPLLAGQSFAALITDPPYRSLDIDVCRGTTTRLVNGGGFASRKGDRIGSGEWFQTLSDEELQAVLAACDFLMPSTGTAYVFADVKTGLALFPTLPVRNVIVWDKTTIGMGYAWRRMHEWIAYCPKSDHKLRRPGFGDIIRCPGVDEKFHPTEKPVGVITPLILNSTDEGDAILDPFAGAGSALLAARLAGRRAVGIECDERFCEIAAARLRQGILFGRISR